MLPTAGGFWKKNCRQPFLNLTIHWCFPANIFRTSHGFVNFLQFRMSETHLLFRQFSADNDLDFWSEQPDAERGFCNLNSWFIQFAIESKIYCNLPKSVVLNRGASPFVLCNMGSDLARWYKSLKDKGNRLINATIEAEKHSSPLLCSPEPSRSDGRPRYSSASWSTGSRSCPGRPCRSGGGRRSGGRLCPATTSVTKQLWPQSR